MASENSVLVLRLKARLQGMLTDNTLAQELLEDAKAACTAYMNREELPDECEGAMLRMACALYNRLGMEGESSHSEGGVNSSVEGIPADVRAMLRPYRLAKTGA